MEKALEQEVTALIEKSIKGVTDQVGSLAEAVKPVSTLVKTVEDLTGNVKVVADTLAKLPPAQGADKGADKGKGDQPQYLTAADLAKVLDEREAKRTGSAKRDSFIADKLKDLPAAYREKLGTDESKWASEEQVIREQLKADLKALGATVADKGGAPTGQPLTEIAKPHELPTAEFAKAFLPKITGAEVKADAK